MAAKASRMGRGKGSVNALRLLPVACTCLWRVICTTCGLCVCISMKYSGPSVAGNWLVFLLVWSSRNVTWFLPVGFYYTCWRGAFETVHLTRWCGFLVRLSWQRCVFFPSSRALAIRKGKKKKDLDFVVLTACTCTNCFQRSSYTFLLERTLQRRDEERGLFFHTKQRAKIVNEDGGTASNSSCRKRFSHIPSNWRESGIHRSESLEIGREESHTTVLGILDTNFFFFLFFICHPLHLQTGFPVSMLSALWHKNRFLIFVEILEQGFSTWVFIHRVIDQAVV